MIIFYDGKCPLCTNYVTMLRLKNTDTVHLVDARRPGRHTETLQTITNAGYNLDEGMLVYHSENIYHGSDALHYLALLSTKSGLFNRFIAWLFRSNQRAKLLYPLLRAGRNLTLQLLRVEKIRGDGDYS